MTCPKCGSNNTKITKRQVQIDGREATGIKVKCRVCKDCGVIEVLENYTILKGVLA